MENPKKYTFLDWRNKKEDIHGENIRVYPHIG